MTYFYIISVACLVAMNCSLLGSFLILRRMAMIGDAISHSVLPGIVIAYLFADSRSSLIMLLGAALSGFAAIYLISFLSNKIKVQADAAIGITFTFLFAIGIILISLFAGNSDIDQDCVLYGEIAYVPLDMIELNTIHIPRALVLMILLFFSLVFFVWYFFKPLLITSFNPEFAKTAGLNVNFWHFCLMGAVSLTTVTTFELVGAILVVAFLVVPAATAYLVTRSLRNMIYVSMAAGILSAVSGFLLALWLQASITGCMAVCSGLLFASTLLLKSIFQRKAPLTPSF